MIARTWASGTRMPSLQLAQNLFLKCSLPGTKLGVQSTLPSMAPQQVVPTSPSSLGEHLELEATSIVLSARLPRGARGWVARSVAKIGYARDGRCRKGYRCGMFGEIAAEASIGAYRTAEYPTPYSITVRPYNMYQEGADLQSEGIFRATSFR